MINTYNNPSALWKAGIEAEDIVAEYLEERYYSIKFPEPKYKITHTRDIEEQKHGIDAIVHSPNWDFQLFIDEKSSQNHMNEGLTSFMFPISVLEDGIWREGWFVWKEIWTDYWLIHNVLTYDKTKKVASDLTHKSEIEAIPYYYINVLSLREKVENILGSLQDLYIRGQMYSNTKIFRKYNDDIAFIWNPNGFQKGTYSLILSKNFLINASEEYGVIN